MATALAVPITKLPPGPERRELHYNNRLHIEPKYPVSAEFKAGGEVSSPGIAFEDYRSMSTQVHKQSGERRLPTPIWSLSDELLRKTLVAYMESRAGFRTPQTGTEQERLERAQQKISETRPEHIATLKRLCAEFVTLKQSAEPDAYRLKKLQEQIANIDTVIRLLDGNIAATVVGCVHAYYRRAIDSVATAAEFSMRPPHVRQLFWRLNRTWDRLNGIQRPASKHCGPPRRVQVDTVLAAQLRAEGKSNQAIALIFGCDWQTVVNWLRRAGLYQPLDRHQRTAKVRTKVRTFRTVQEHVALLEKLAVNNGGKLPTRTWLNHHGFWSSYAVMMQNPTAFAHLQREFGPRLGRRPRNTRRESCGSERAMRSSIGLPGIIGPATSPKEKAREEPVAGLKGKTIQ
jgi:hypothetical protein